MSVFRFTESRDSRETTSEPPSYIARYTAAGTTSASFVKSYALSATASIVSTVEGVLYRNDLRVSPVGYELWKVEVNYGPTKSQTGEYRLSFDTSGGTVHLTNSRQTVASYGTNPPDHGQLIGVNDGQVEGVDAVIPALTINLTFKHPLGVISLPRIKDLARYTGSVNSETFLTFAPGEVLFLGARGDQGTDQETSVEYSFAMSENVTGQTIGDLTIDKDGHDYAWFRWVDDVDQNRAVKKPEFGYVERIYPRVDLGVVLGV